MTHNLRHRIFDRYRITPTTLVTLKAVHLMPFYLRFQQFTGKVNPAFNGTQWFAQHICNFMVFKTIKI